MRLSYIPEKVLFFFNPDNKVDEIIFSPVIVDKECHPKRKKDVSKRLGNCEIIEVQNDEFHLEFPNWFEGGVSTPSIEMILTHSEFPDGIKFKYDIGVHQLLQCIIDSRNIISGKIQESFFFNINSPNAELYYKGYIGEEEVEKGRTIGKVVNNTNLYIDTKKLEIGKQYYIESKSLFGLNMYEICLFLGEFEVLLDSYGYVCTIYSASLTTGSLIRRKNMLTFLDTYGDIIVVPLKKRDIKIIEKSFFGEDCFNVERFDGIEFFDKDSIFNMICESSKLMNSSRCSLLSKEYIKNNPDKIIHFLNQPSNYYSRSMVAAWLRNPEVANLSEKEVKHILDSIKS